MVNLEGMFYSASSFNQDISRWDVSSVRGFNQMFRYAIKFDQDLSHWNVAKATTMEFMFRGATAFNQVRRLLGDLDIFKTTGITRTPINLLRLSLVSVTTIIGHRTSIRGTSRRCWTCATCSSTRRPSSRCYAGR